MICLTRQCTRPPIRRRFLGILSAAELRRWVQKEIIMEQKIYQWQDICDHFNGTILLGNGASIAVDHRFAYSSLLKHASKIGLLSQDIKNIFRSFKTEDFELILRLLWITTKVNSILSVPNQQIIDAYSKVKNCLIETIVEVHPEYSVIENQLLSIYNFLKQFNTVLSLNYDLIVYWAMMTGFDIQDQHTFKDCFINNYFEDNWRRLREPIGSNKTTTLVFYPHGNLILARNIYGQELKIISETQASLLESIVKQWQEGNIIPLFVGEGTTKQKMLSIHNSYYLSRVYREVLPSISSNLVVYGWGFGKHDIHILKQIRHVKSFAISVYNTDYNYCERVQRMVNSYIGNRIELCFFDSQSPGCWNN